MRHPRLFKPESIANVQIEIQIVDTHESLETRIVIGLHAFDHQINRTILIFFRCGMPLCKPEFPMAGRKPLLLAIKQIKGTLQKCRTNAHEPRPTR